MSLWCDKYRPCSFSKIEFNKEASQQLCRLAGSHDFPNLLIFGPSGAGKKTRVNCFLKELFGSGVEKLRLETLVIETPSRKKLEIRTVASNYHIEVNPSDLGIYDRLVIQELVKTNAATSNLHNQNIFGQASSSGSIKKAPIKVVVVSEADKLTKDAQAALRRTMEKYMSTFRIILTAESSSRLIPAIKSRTLMVRVPAPTVSDITRIIMSVSKKENFNLNQPTAELIAESCDRNLRRALVAAEAVKVSGRPVVTSSPVIPQWHVFIKALAGKIMRDQTPIALDKMRSDLYQLQAHMITPEVILRFLVKELLELTSLVKKDHLHPHLIELAAFYEFRLRQGSKAIIHLEAFIAQFMSCCKTNIK